MKHTKPHRSQRLKLSLTIVVILAAGAAMIALSIWMRPELPAPAVRPASTQPASAPAVPAAPIDPKTANAQNLSGLLLLVGLACLLVAVVYVILLVIDIRNSRPAWQRQTKYPKRR
jgi:hypothetical protein